MSPAKPSEVALAKTWMQLQGWPVMPDWGFPDLCYVVPDLAACWLFTTNSGIYWIEYLTANPLAPKEARRRALVDLIQWVSARAKDMGARAVFVSTPHPGAVRAYKEAGFTLSEGNASHLILKLEN